MAEDDGIIIEFYSVGAYVKVSAVDPASLIEVSIVGDPSRGESALIRTVVDKLNYVLERRGRQRQRRGGARS